MLQKFKKMDVPVLMIIFMLMIISIVCLYSATHGDAKLEGHHIKMLAFYILGFGAVFAITLVDYRLLVKYALYIYFFGLLILLAANFFGGKLNNATGWINLGPISIQPAELFKLILVIFLASVLIKRGKAKLEFWRDVVPIGLMTFVPFGLVMLQNDLGNAMAYVVILIGLLWIGNIKASHALIGFVIIAVLVGGGIKLYKVYHDNIYDYLDKLGRAHWAERFDPWLVPEKATAKASWHTDNAKLAIGSGGITGKGFMQGTSVQSGRVPYTYSDSIFVLIAEEFGFVGSSVVLLLYFILIHRMILIALETKERSGPYIIVGIVAMYLYQVFENIGAFIGLMPLTGITLPFISYGGTSLLINMASIGLIMSIKVHGQEVDDDILAPGANGQNKKRVFGRKQAKA
ncbi:FtsW/RodA/SpoVE family cell cycle protein [Paenibacillus sp. Marseille-Q7038]